MRLNTSSVNTVRSIKTNLRGHRRGEGPSGGPQQQGDQACCRLWELSVVAARGHPPATLTPLHACQAHPCCHPGSCQAGVGVLPCSGVKSGAKGACSPLAAGCNALGPISGPLPHLAPKAPAHAASCPRNPYFAPISLVMVFVKCVPTVVGMVTAGTGHGSQSHYMK